uniref:FBA_2 domain-containing protein n=1 Tax=Caenorhabditis tropicalis TaxID=1561998 RepID=A0A1I7TUJ7_9PELO
MITWIESQFLQSCVTFLFAFLNFITFNYFKVNESWTRTSLEVDQFPLLRLPLLAREHVLCMMTPFELIDLSMTSSKAKRAVIFFSRIKSRFSVSLCMIYSSFIFIKGHENEWAYVWKRRQSLAGRSPYHIAEFSTNPRTDCLRWYDAIKEVLGCRIDDCVSRPDKSLTDWLRSNQSSIEKITLMHGDQEDFKYFFKTIKFPKGINHLEVQDSKFINYEQLMRLKARNIVLRWSYLTSQEINRFLKSWMSMESHLDLECFQINFCINKALNEIMDLPNKVTADPNSMERMRRCFPKYTMENGFDIRRSDGKVATVCLGRNNWIVAVLFNSSAIGTD